ncbi:hypothetical protein [Noviherbaspirillum sedimenti]|uniref:hypothetical protein n=1 Tax=Noviherbaspirillum sedimenti TaxID=2320865 RepID=UPI0011C3BE6A|nr:hypothetical protein [Noviherbaspirillum sedimenti]
MKAFVDGIRELQQRGLAKSWSEEELMARAAELPEELQSSLNSVALFEVLVQDHGGEFDPYSISEKETTAVAWEPTYLSVDGEEHIGEESMPAASSFRVAFYVHEWPEGGTLIGPAGVLSLPEFKPVPERLWKLAPYALLD